MEEFEQDIYFEEGAEEAIRDDEISPEEEAFMNGYNEDMEEEE